MVSKYAANRPDRPVRVMRLGASHRGRSSVTPVERGRSYSWLGLCTLSQVVNEHWAHHSKKADEHRLARYIRQTCTRIASGPEAPWLTETSSACPDQSGIPPASCPNLHSLTGDTPQICQRPVQMLLASRRLALAHSTLDSHSLQKWPTATNACTGKSNSKDADVS